MAKKKKFIIRRIDGRESFEYLGAKQYKLSEKQKRELLKKRKRGRKNNRKS